MEGTASPLLFNGVLMNNNNNNTGPVCGPVCEHMEKVLVAHPGWRHRFATIALAREYFMLVITDAPIFS